MAGSCTAPVEITDTMSPGVVSLPHGHGASDVNQLLTTADVDPLNGMPIMSGFAVSGAGAGLRLTASLHRPPAPLERAGATRAGAISWWMAFGPHEPGGYGAHRRRVLEQRHRQLPQPLDALGAW